MYMNLASKDSVRLLLYTISDEDFTSLLLNIDTILKFEIISIIKEIFQTFVKSSRRFVHV